MPSIISITKTGDYKKTKRFLHNIIAFHYANKLRRYGERGVKALKEATPEDTGKTKDSWTYEIVEEPGKTSLYWRNSNMNKGVNIAVILQYGHGTKNGGYVEGVDYINPALKPVFQAMADDIWKEVVSS